MWCNSSRRSSNKYNDEFIMSNICVYRHLKPCNEVFYIGIGTIKRPHSKHNRNKHWKNIVNKHGYKIEILHENLSWNLACEIEICLIKFYGRKDLGLGKLVNMTDGGDGVLGFKHSEKSKLNMKITNKNKVKKGRICLEETKLKLSKINKEYKHTEKAKRNISLNNKRKQKIIDISTGIIYNSINEVLEKFNLKQSTLCSYLSGKRKNKTNFQYYLKHLEINK